MLTFRRIVTAAAVAAALLGGSVGTASATPSGTETTAASVAVVHQTDDRDLRSTANLDLTYTFGKDATYAIWAAALYGDAIALACSNVVPEWAAPVCDVIQYAAQTIANLGEPGYHDCLKVYPRLGWPPIGVLYVYC